MAANTVVDGHAISTDDGPPASPITHGAAIPWLVFAVGLVVFFVGSWWRPWWLDEDHTLSALRRSFSDLTSLIQNGDVPLGPYYLVMTPWHTVSESAVWLRAPSVIAMAGVAAVLAALGSRMVNSPAGPVVGLGAGLFFIAIPAVSRYAQEARPYAFATFFACSATYFWWRACTGERRMLWVAYCACVVAMGLFHAFALPLLVAQLVCCLLLPVARRRLVAFIVSAGISVLLLSPFLWLLAGKANGPATRPVVDVTNLAHLAGFVTGGWLMAGLFGGLVVAGAVAALRDARLRPPLVVGIAWLVVGPLILIPVQLYADVTTLMSRYYVVFIPGLCLAAAVGVAYLVSHWRYAPVAIGIVVVALTWTQQVQVRSGVANQLRDGVVMELAIDTPALAGAPVWPNEMAFTMISVLSPGDVAVRVPFFSQDFSRGRLAPEPSFAQHQRAALAGAPMVVVAVSNLSEVDARAKPLARLGFTQVLLRCSGPYAALGVFSKLSESDRVASADTILHQVKAATGSELTCTAGR